MVGGGRICSGLVGVFGVGFGLRSIWSWVILWWSGLVGFVRVWSGRSAAVRMAEADVGQAAVLMLGGRRYHGVGWRGCGVGGDAGRFPFGDGNDGERGRV